MEQDAIEKVLAGHDDSTFYADHFEKAGRANWYKEFRCKCGGIFRVEYLEKVKAAHFRHVAAALKEEMDKEPR